MSSISSKNKLHFLLANTSLVVLCVGALAVHTAYAQTIVTSISSPSLNSSGDVTGTSPYSTPSGDGFDTVDSSSGGTLNYNSGSISSPSSMDSAFGIGTQAATQFTYDNAPALQTDNSQTVGGVSQNAKPSSGGGGGGGGGSSGGPHGRYDGDSHGGSISTMGHSGRSRGHRCPSGYFLYRNQCYDSTYCSRSGSKVSCDCKLGNQTIRNGRTVRLYKDSVVQYGNTCQSQQRTCQSDGTFSGSSAYNKSSCYIKNPTITGVSITASPDLLRKGEDTTIRWNGGNSESCEVSGPELDSNGLSGSETITNLQHSSTYYIKCTLGPTTWNGDVEVHILPTYQET